MSGTLIGSYLTGRSRPFGFNGTWGGQAKDDRDSIIQQIASSFAASVSQINLWEINLNVMTDGPSGIGAYAAAGPCTLSAQWDSFWGPYISGPPSTGVTFTPAYDPRGKGPDHFDYSGSGTWALSVSSVVEVVQIYLDTDRSDASGFPTYGGANQPDQPFNYQLVFLEVVPPGAAMTLTATYSGGPGPSISLTGTATDYLPVQYALSIDTICVTGFTPLTEPGANGSCYVTPDASLGLWGMSFSPSYSFPGVSSGSANFLGGITCSQSITTTAHAGAPSAWCTCQAQYMATTPFAIDGAIRTPAGVYQDQISIAVDGGVTGGVLCDSGTFGASGIQYAGNAVFQEFYSSSTVANSPGFAYSQSQGGGPIDCYIPRSELTRLKEDVTNWRFLLRGWSWPSLSINQQSITAPDPHPGTAHWSGSNATLTDITVDGSACLQAEVGSTGTGSISRSWSNINSGWLGTSFRGYRYLRLKISAQDSDGNPLDAQGFTVTIPGVGDGNVTKTWTGKTSVSAGATDIDLCIPDVADSTDDKDCSYPLLANPPRAVLDGPFWGVTNVESLQISGLAASTTWVLEEVQLSRDVYTRATMLPGFNNWIDSHEEDDDGATPAQYRVAFTAETDGRVSLERFDSIRQSDGMGGWVYTPPTISGLIALITGDEAGNTFEGWQASEAYNPTGPHCGDPIPPLSCYLQNSQVEAVMLCGGGLLYLYNGKAWGWQSTIEQDLGAGGVGLPAQLLFDSVVLYPGCGDVFGFALGTNKSKYGIMTPLAAGKINLRGVSWGILVRDEGDSGSYRATLTDTTMTPNVGGGVGNCDAGPGVYQTGNPGARGLHDTTTTTVYNGTTYSVGRNFDKGGRRYRACLRASGQAYRVLEVDSRRSWLHVGYLNKIQTFHLADYTLVQAGQAISAIDHWTSLRIDERRGVMVASGYKAGSGGGSPTCSLWQSTDGGATLTEVYSVTANSMQVARDSERGLFQAVYADSSHNLWILYSLDGGQTWGTPSAVTASSSQLTGMVLSLAYDHRRSRLLLSVGNVAGTTAQVYASTDAGLTWELVITEMRGTWHSRL
jgi:hypothetical protein